VTEMSKMSKQNPDETAVTPFPIFEADGIEEGAPRKGESKLAEQAPPDPEGEGFELSPLSDLSPLSEEMQSDIAPIGPTEYAGPASSPSGPSSRGFGDASAPSSRGFGDASAPSSRGFGRASVRGPLSVEQFEQQIHDLEERLDEMIGQGRPAALKSDRAPAELTPSPSEKPGPAEEPSQTTAREVLSGEFYLRQWGRTGVRKRAEDVDDFGLDPAYEARAMGLLDFLYKSYFRVEVEGIEHVPDEGRCLIVSNHSSGPLPYDGLMLRTTLRREHPQKREMRWLAEDFVYYLPFVGAMMTRLGAVRACQENAERLLSQGRLVAVFPEGAKGIGKLFRDRYRLQRFGRGGFIRLCLRTHTPIVPCAIVGAEEANPMLYRIEYMAKTLGVPYLPITPTFPALGPIGLLPAPTKWKVSLGEPIHFDSYGPEAADDEILVGRLSERVRATIQGMLDRTLAGRRSIWFG
jgi:1-acyl-sn-glycerol-3-phosphate acyltransferase